MGAIFKTGRLVLGKDSIHVRFNQMIDYDYETRSSDEDMYRGDFGSSTVRKNPLACYKGKSENVINKNSEKFLNEFEEKFEKYVIDYAITGQLGYIAEAAKVNMYISGSIRGGILLRIGYSHERYDNITQLKKKLRENPRFAQRVAGCEICDKNWNVVGRVGTDSRVYKTKPKQLPKKYQWIDELVHVTYASWNPY